MRKLGTVDLEILNLAIKGKGTFNENNLENSDLKRYGVGKILDALASVDLVVVFDEETPAEIIKTLIPDVLVKGGDYTPETIVGADTVTANGGEVKIIPFRSGQSTSIILEKIIKL